MKANDLSVKSGRGRLKPGTRVGGMWSIDGYTHPGAGNKGELWLDGGSDTGDSYPDTVRHIYAHELGHAVDGHGEFSNTDEWDNAAGPEIVRDDAPLSDYAMESAVEAFAEFHRLLNTDRTTASRQFPKTYAYWQKIGMVE
jgi:hypothetical protein